MRQYLIWKWIERGEIKRKWGKYIILCPFSLHFLILSPFPHAISISSQFPHFLSISSSFSYSLSIFSQPSCQDGTSCATLYLTRPRQCTQCTQFVRQPPSLMTFVNIASSRGSRDDVFYKIVKKSLIQNDPQVNLFTKCEMRCSQYLWIVHRG